MVHRAAAVVLVAGLAYEHRAFSRDNPVLLTGGSPPLGTVERVDATGWSAALSSIPDDAIEPQRLVLDRAGEFVTLAIGPGDVLLPQAAG